MKTTRMIDKIGGCIRIIRLLLTMTIILVVCGCASVKDHDEPRMAISTVTSDDPLLAHSTMGYRTGTEPPNARIYMDPDADLSRFRRYAFDYGNQENPLLEKELFKMLETVLSQKGMTRNESTPDVLITMSFFIGRRENYIPPKTITTTRIENVWDTVHVIGGSTPVPVTESQIIPGRMEVRYYNNIRVNMLDYAKLKSGEKLKTPPLVWMGEVEVTGTQSDIRNSAPGMFVRLLWGPPGKITIGPLQMEGYWSDKAFVVRSVQSASHPIDINERDIIRTIQGVSPIDYASRNKNSMPASISGPHCVESANPLTSSHFITSNYYIYGNTVEIEIEAPSTKTTRKVLVKQTPR